VRLPPLCANCSHHGVCSESGRGFVQRRRAHVALVDTTPYSPGGGTPAHSVLTSHNKPVPTTPYSPAGGTPAHSVLTSHGGLWDAAGKFNRFSYPELKKQQGGFKLHVEPGDFTDSEIIIMLGENGTGKTTFIRMLAVRPTGDRRRRAPPRHRRYRVGRVAEDTVSRRMGPHRCQLSS
jgi:hypothetical protein